MENLKKTQVLTLSLIATLLSITPLLASSFRSTYIYFIINVLIVVLGAEAGFLSSSSSSSSSSSLPLMLNKTLEEGDKKTSSSNNSNNSNIIVTTKTSFSSLKTIVENSLPEKKIVVNVVNEVKKMIIKKCPSTPSMFFIGSGYETEAEDEVEENVHEEEEEEEEEEKLFVKAEAFIGNFYRQLQMQREKSWNRIHGFNENCLIR